MKKGVYFLIQNDELYSLLNHIKKNQIKIYDLIIYDKDYYQFCTSYYDSVNIHKKIPNLIYLKSVGMIHYLGLFFSKKFRVVGILFSIFMFIFLNQLNYGCIIEKTYPHIDKMIEEKCREYGVYNISFQLNADKLEDIQNNIYNDLKDKISYIELYKEGKYYKLKYLKKIKETTRKSNYSIYVSSEDAIIDLIDVRSGNVMVEKGQYVAKGDILVSNEIISTNESSRLVEVDGKIYGYVYHTIQSSVKGDLNVDTFTYLYQEISKKISSKINNDGHIVSENVLQYAKKEGKIVLKVQFTLYQNIAQERFIDE